MTKESQTKQIFDYLMGGSRLTGLEALQIFGTIKCSNRIFEVERDYGLRVEREWKEVNSAHGKKRVIEYYIKRNEL